MARKISDLPITLTFNLSSDYTILEQNGVVKRVKGINYMYSVRGPQGLQGSIGVQGLQGFQGSQGFQGIQGAANSGDPAEYNNSPIGRYARTHVGVTIEISEYAP